MKRIFLAALFVTSLIGQSIPMGSVGGVTGPVPAYVGGAITNVQSGSVSYTVTANANCLFLFVHSANGATATIGQSGTTNAWTNIANNEFIGSGPDWMLAWIAPVSVAGATTITMTGGGGVSLQVAIVEYSGVAAISPVDGTVGIGTNSASVTTTVSGDLLVFAANGEGGSPATNPTQTGSYNSRPGGFGTYGGTERGMSIFDTLAGAPGMYSNGVGNFTNRGSILIAVKP